MIEGYDRLKVRRCAALDIGADLGRLIPPIPELVTGIFKDLVLPFVLS